GKLQRQQSVAKSNPLNPRDQRSSEATSLIISKRSQSERAGKISRRFGDRSDREIDLAAVSGIVAKVVGPGLICDRPATFGSWITSNPSDKAVICRPRGDTEVNDVELLQGLKGDRAADADCQSRMCARCAKRQLNDGTGTHGHGAFHGQGLAGRSGTCLEYRTARGDRDRAVDGAGAAKDAAAVVYRSGAARSKRPIHKQCSRIDGCCAGVCVDAGKCPGA